ncbi:hypothetical protein [Streptomyces sp. NPDC001792]
MTTPAPPERSDTTAGDVTHDERRSDGGRVTPYFPAGGDHVRAE